MNQRKTTRYDCSRFAEPLRELFVIAKDKKSIEASVLNLCSQGMRISISQKNIGDEIPQKNDPVNVCLLKSIIIKGQCIYVTTEEDQSISMGIYFSNPNEQNYLKELLSELLY